MSGAGPKKEKLGSSVRSVLNDQLAKLQTKHLAEIDLLDEFRSFLKQRCQLERDYAQGLQKLGQQYLSKKEMKPPPPLAEYDRLENRGVLEIWKLMLTKVEEQGKRRLELSEMLTTNVSEMLRSLRKEKDQQFKTSCEVMQRMISESLDSVKELTTAKKVYSERQKTCEEARLKYSDLDDRLRKKEMKLFESRSTLEKNHKKTADKLRSAQKHAVGARNEYLLCLEVANTLLHKHFETELPLIMKTMDGEMYDKMKTAYTLFAQIEADSCSFIKAEFADLREQAQLVNREYVLECFLHEYPFLRNKILYQFEPVAGDKVKAISRDHGAELILNKQARFRAQELIKHQQMIVEKGKAIRGLESVTLAYKTTPEFGTADARSEAQLNMSALQEELRQLEVVTTRANARLDALKESGIDVDKWLQQATTTTAADYIAGERKQSQAVPAPDLLGDEKSLASSFSGSQVSLGDSLETGSETTEQAPDSVSLNSNPTFGQLVQQPKYCVALYSYQAQRYDELDIQSDEELEILEWDNGDGWSQGKNKTGQEGYFPQSYVKPCNTSPFSSSPCPPQIFTQSSDNNNEVMLRALYEYTAEDREELSFPEGAIIKLIATDSDGSGIDDGWWKGSYGGREGVFPSVIVEVASGNIQALSSLPSLSFDLTPMPLESLAFPYVPPPPPPPPPDYPAPEISAEDLAIGPNLRTVPNIFNADVLSGLTPTLTSLAPPIASTPTKSGNLPTQQGRTGRSSTVVSQGGVNDSFERTLCSSNRWSSFEDIDDDENESFV